MWKTTISDRSQKIKHTMNISSLTWILLVLSAMSIGIMAPLFLSPSLERETDLGRARRMGAAGSSKHHVLGPPPHRSSVIMNHSRSFNESDPEFTQNGGDAGEGHGTPRKMWRQESFTASNEREKLHFTATQEGGSIVVSAPRGVAVIVKDDPDNHAISQALPLFSLQSVREASRDKPIEHQNLVIEGSEEVRVSLC